MGKLILPEIIREDIKELSAKGYKEKLHFKFSITMALRDVDSEEIFIIKGIMKISPISSTFYLTEE